MINLLPLLHTWLLPLPVHPMTLFIFLLLHLAVRHPTPPCLNLRAQDFGSPGVMGRCSCKARDRKTSTCSYRSY